MNQLARADDRYGNATDKIVGPNNGLNEGRPRCGV